MGKGRREIPSEDTVTAWGGARNFASRETDSLSLRQANGVIRAAKHALAAGLPLNRHVTIHWEKAGIEDRSVASVTGRFLTLARDWIRKHAGEFAWVFVRENGSGKGAHVHILMHLPPELAHGFVRRQRGWLERVTGRKYVPTTIRTRLIGGTIKAATVVPEHYAANLGTAVRYIVKGSCDDARKHLGLRLHEPGGVVIGKRAGWSENLGGAVRGEVQISLPEAVSVSIEEAIIAPDILTTALQHGGHAMSVESR